MLNNPGHTQTPKHREVFLAPREAGAGVEGRAHGSAGMGVGNDQTVPSASL